MPFEPTIFVVDDDVAVQDSLRVLLETADLAVATYGSGEEFLEDYDCQDSGCVLLDLDLPVMKGLDVIEALAARECRVPVILITGRGDRTVRERLHRSGAFALLEKPVRDELLLGTIRHALAQSDPTSPSSRSD